MATKYLALLTNIGAAKLAKATALGTKVEITQMAVGDGNGVLPTPNPAQTALVHELRRAPLNMLTVDPENASQIIAEQVIPEDVGGWWIREIGLFDKDGDMVAIANCAETYKPQLQEGSGRVQVIRMILIVSSTDAVTLKIDPAVVLATRQYVDSKLSEHEQSRNHPDASTTGKGLVQLSSSVDSDSESQAATPKAVKIAMDNAGVRLEKDRNLSDLPNTALARQNLELGDSSTKNVGTTAGTVASGDDDRIVGAMQKNQNGGDIPDVEAFRQNLGLGASAFGLQNCIVFDTAGVTDWAVPDELKNGRKCKVTVIGGGGSGGRNRGAGGGGGGGKAVKLMDLTGVDYVPITVGAGGVKPAASTTPISGNTGGSSSFGTYFSATGGAGGGNVSAGSPGIGVNGDINTTTGPGNAGAFFDGTTFIGGSGGGAGGQGSLNTTSSDGADAIGPGGGGAGAAYGATAVSCRPGAGFSGLVMIEW